MTVNEFVIKYQGQFVDTDGAFGGQCMDLMHKYCQDVLSIADLSVLAAPSARDVYVNFDTVKGHDLFEKIDNTPTGVPQEGDIMFWGNAPYGHVAVFISGNANSFTSFDQNFPLNSPCHVQGHTYANVVGWLHKKGTVNLQAELDACRVDRDNHWNDLLAVSGKLKVDANMTVILAELDKLISYEDAVVQKDQQIADAGTKLAKLQTQFDALTANHETMRVENAKLAQEVQEQQDTIQLQGVKISTLSESLQSLKDSIKNPRHGLSKAWEGILEIFGRR